jgi:hypothetical protein
METQFEVRLERNGELVTTVQCPNCTLVADHELCALRVGADVSCIACGRRMLITPGDWEEINEKVRLARKRWNERALSRPSPRSLTLATHATGDSGRG